MSTALVVLETQDLAAAARMLRLWAAEPVESRVTALSRELDGCGGMAGSDPGGVAWAASYDRAATVALQAAADLADAIDRLAQMFAQTARNYEAADSASTADERRLVDSAVASLPRFGHSFGLPVCMPPSAAGGSGGGPPGWGLISGAIGHVWPNGHQGRLREAAAAWTACGEALRRGADDTVSAARLAIDDGLPEAADMWTVCNSLGEQLRRLADVHRSLGAACEALAQHLDEVHAAVEGELESLLEWTGGIQAVGGLFSVFTFGAAEGPTQAVEAARIGVTASRVAHLIERFSGLVRTLAQSTAPIADRALAVSARVRVFLDAKLTEAAVTTVRRYRTVRLSGDTGAIGRLGGEAGEHITIFTDRAAARRALDGPMRSVCNQFFKDAGNKGRDFKIIEQTDGTYRMQFFSPADNPGYGKLYVRIIDRHGDTVERYKDTLGPNGLIERKHMGASP